MSDPLSLSEIYDHLPIATVEWTAQRNDEISISGGGEYHQNELADPLWTAPVTLGTGRHGELKRAAALIRSLRGSQQAFLICDPTSLWPQADPKGLILGARNVTIRSIASSRATALLAGLPAAYKLTAGDKLQITYGNPLKFAFVEVSRDVTASAGGQADISVFPWLPLSLVAGAKVTLIRPACPVVIVKDTHRPGTARNTVTENASFTVIERRRRAL
ncbi:hypothetical protein F9L06_03860 [Brucella anthropi]|uniref:Uncharacterized protein n=1 Tax=Brucella anthropi TaxID=529 RepID=A0A6I0DWB3_BRUAN|nr:hypothetical protein [Brucella anthropi]KAB2803303.1 hypothetical protein F9L06_03860 [Brucella anthropi]